MTLDEKLKEWQETIEGREFAFRAQTRGMWVSENKFPDRLLLAALKKCREQRDEYFSYLPEWHKFKYGNSAAEDDAELLAILNGGG